MPPKNGSPDALHADHVLSLTETHVRETITPDDWLTLLKHIGLVVCVTASENYRLEQRERIGVTGGEKYKSVGVKVMDVETGRPIAPSSITHE